MGNKSEELVDECVKNYIKNLNDELSFKEKNLYFNKLESLSFVEKQVFYLKLDEAEKTKKEEHLKSLKMEKEKWFVKCDQTSEKAEFDNYNDALKSMQDASKKNLMHTFCLWVENSKDGRKYNQTSLYFSKNKGAKNDRT